MGYLLLFDTFSKASDKFGTPFFEDDFEPNENHIVIQYAYRSDLTDMDREFILSFVEGLLSFKPSIDYVVDFFYVEQDLEFDYPTNSGFVELVEKINRLFNRNIMINDFQSFNNILQQ
ncbi:hypothetical protein X560_1124 [Listeria fleischmannii 1991]|nr:hypothetical protein [Listeria fleischmannii]KMT60198.1 hypothetical protein X560_1124 [Listeria fleischmannii 1991]